MKTVKTFIQKWFSIDLAFGIGTIAEDSGQIADSYQKGFYLLYNIRHRRTVPFTAIAIIITYFHHALLVWIFTTAFLWHCVRHHWKMRKKYCWKLNNRFCCRILTCILLSFYYLRFFPSFFLFFQKKKLISMMCWIMTLFYIQIFF